MPIALSGFSHETLSFLTESRTVYRRGEGPAVLIMTEIPGITPAVAAFAARVAEAGFSVWMPQLFGTPGAALSPLAVTQTLARVCISKEFKVLASHQSSPITAWLRALARHAHDQCGGPGVGAVGMCLTGNFGIALMLDAPIQAAVLSQPSLPIGPLPAQRAGLHASPEEIAAAQQRIEEHGARLLALRFEGDPMCPAARFETLRSTFGEGVETIELPDSTARRGTGTPAHSVLTTHLIDEAGQPTRAALDRTLAFLTEQLT